MDDQTFWREVNALPAYFKRQGVTVHPDTAYLNHLLTYVQHGRMPGLTNARLRELGAQIRFHPGLPDFFRGLRVHLDQDPEAQRFEIRLEHYIVSTGLRAMIEGSAIYPFVNGVWASEFLESPAGPGLRPGRHRGPGRTLQGRERIPVPDARGRPDRRGLRQHQQDPGPVRDQQGQQHRSQHPGERHHAPEDRRVPFQHMVYIADGPSDVPAFSVIRHNQGIAYAVYDPAEPASLKQVDRLRRDGRIDHFGPADYRPGYPTSDWLTLQVDRIAAAIAAERRTALKERVGEAPRHLPH